MKDMMRAESFSETSMSKSIINSTATNMLNENHDTNQPILRERRTFANSFLWANSDLSCAKLIKLDIQRLNAVCKQDLIPWYDLLQYLYDIHAYLVQLIFNIDEASLQLLEDRNGAIIFPSDLTSSIKQTSERMANATLVLGIATDGFSIPSVIFWPLANVPEEFQGSIGHKYFTWSNKIGWMNMEISEKYFLTVHLLAIKKRRVSIGDPKA
ncbi:MAG: hypothetical protein EZS28_001170 [Streblomastix strix]|uniref:DDE-1 domain-containing protein n=1 Tax=Streblomastix strix TaxID=222440 RepID=A0A5J4X7U0_9EUKA|nr:MAG: hypothetical protein EZS28_001170 [Streblomastix strix]